VIRSFLPGGRAATRIRALTCQDMWGHECLRFIAYSFPAVVLACVALAGVVPRALHAQSEGNQWEVETELGGSVFFGNRQQSQVNMRTEVELANSLFESLLEGRFTYGVATDGDGVSQVNRRSWLLRSSVDLRPESRWRPFVSGQAESVFERRIALRYDAGTGIKYDNRIDRDNRVEFSMAIIAERTYRRGDTSSGAEQVSLGRWSSDLRVRRTFLSDRLGIDFRNQYRPVFDELGNFVLSSRNAFTVDLTEVVGLRFAVQTEYDSGARERGADTNLDGQIQLGVVASF